MKNRAWLAAAILVLSGLFAEPCRADAPKGWSFDNPSEGYETVTDDAVIRDGGAAVAIRTKTSRRLAPGVGHFGILYQTISAERYRGHRVLFSAYVRSRDVDGSAAVWMRVDGSSDRAASLDAESGGPLGFDRTEFAGGADWRKVEIVLQVPKQAEAVTFGYSLYGNGAVWANGLRFEAVDPSIPITDHRPKLSNKPMPSF